MAIDISNNEELIDIRTDSIGYTHKLAGNATRATDSNLLKIVGGIYNLYNGQHTEAGTTLNPTTGALEYRTETGIVSDWIPVEPSTTYINTVSADHSIGWSVPFYYDDDKNFISSSTAFSSTFTTPSKCYYLRFSGNNFRIDGKDIQLNEGNVLLPFDGYTPFIRTNVLSDSLNTNYQVNRPTYYLSQYGNDENSGLSEQLPKKTLQSVNGFSDCVILLKSGEEFALTSTDMLYFLIGNNCTLSTYGGSVKPIINGYINLKLVWVQHSVNIYKADLKNQGFYTGANQAYDICNIGHLLVNGAYNGKRVQTLALLLNEGEYYIDETNINLYYYTLSTVTTLEFKAARNTHAICFNNASNSSVFGIEIKGFGRHGIWIRNSKAIKVIDNYVHHIGGCKQSSNGSRYGNGIEVWDNGENITIELNHVTDCFDAGLTNQTTSATVQKNISFRKNTVERCWYCIEEFDGSSTARANFKNIVYEDNILLESTDITKGYRYNAGQISGALFRIYCVSSNKVTLKNNICYLSQCYLIYSADKAGLGGITFDGNIYIQKNKGNLYHPTSHVISANEQLFIINISPSTTEEYAMKSYALSLISNKKILF